MKRKDFIKNTSLAAASLTVIPSMNLFSQGNAPKIRVAIIGVGLRGQNHLDLLLRREDVEVVAICDIDDRMLSMSKGMITKSGKKMPQIFSGDPYAWKKNAGVKRD